MKYRLLLMALFTAIVVSAQERGVSPLSAEASAKAGATYAVVVGISDYQDPHIPDLRFADRDAEEVASYLTVHPIPKHELDGNPNMAQNAGY